MQNFLKYEQWIKESKDQNWEDVALSLAYPDPNNPDRESSWSNQFKVLLEALWEELDSQLHESPSKEEWAKFMSKVFIQSLKDSAVESKAKEIKQRKGSEV